MNWNKLLNNGRLRGSTRNEDARNDFESDFGRIIFSPAVRRMHDKTQVFPLTTDDNIHSRLTHSLEVMSIGYSMGVIICESPKIQKRTDKTEHELIREIPIIMKNICLLHDIGNPPFGHFGEEVIQEYFKNLFRESDKIKKEEDNFTLSLKENEKKDFLNFDGNAQGLRVITKLQRLDDAFGLNLTFATLGAFIKYPNNSDNCRGTLNKKKRGVFCSEYEYFKDISKECGTIMGGNVYMRHPLSYLMEAADSICYLVMDIEDAFNKGLFNLEYLYEKLEPLSEMVGYEKLNADIEETKQHTNNTKKIVSLRIALIGNLVENAVKEFEEKIDEIENNNYNRELLDEKENRLVKILASISREKIFTSRDINSLELTGHSVMSGLLDYYIDFLLRKDNKKYRERASCLISGSIVDIAIEENFDSIIEKRKKEYEGNKDKQEKYDNILKCSEELKTLEERYNESIEIEKETEKELYQKIKQKRNELRKLLEPKIEDLNDYYKLRIIVDFISGMTDQFALNHYRKISGQKIN